MKRVLISALVLFGSITAADALTVAIAPDNTTITVTLTAREALLLQRIRAAYGDAVVEAVWANYFKDRAGVLRSEDAARLCQKWPTLTQPQRDSLKAALALPANPCPD